MADRSELGRRVATIVSEALDVGVETVRPESSLIDDLDAESLDFLDIIFRLETAFDLKIPEQEIWRGSIDPDEPDSIAAGVARLRTRMPGYRWDRLSDPVTRNDLPRLITVQTIVDYLESQLETQTGSGEP